MTFYRYESLDISKHFDHFWIERPVSQILDQAASYSLDLPFRFPFYGEEVEKVLVEPGGQVKTPTGGYISPLSANLDPHHQPNTSSLGYWVSHKNMSITFQWMNAVLSDIPLRLPFTFRLRLWSSGLIEFLYYKLGIGLEHLLVFDNSIKIGVGDRRSGFSVDVERKYVKEKTMVSIRPVSAVSPPPEEDVILSESNLYFKASLVQNPEKARKLWVLVTKRVKTKEIIKLPFSFLLFGSEMTGVVVSGDGFVSMEGRHGYSHTIAPLQAPNTLPLIKYTEAEDSFTVQWEVGDQREFQLTILSAGNIHFVYKKLESLETPVFLGLLAGDSRSQVNLTSISSKLTDWTAISLDPLSSQEDRLCMETSNTEKVGTNR